MPLCLLRRIGMSLGEKARQIIFNHRHIHTSIADETQRTETQTLFRSMSMEKNKEIVLDVLANKLLCIDRVYSVCMATTTGTTRNNGTFMVI